MTTPSPLQAHPLPPALRHLRDEAQLLLALSRLDLDAETVAWCRQLVVDEGPRLDWGFFVDQAARHKLLPLVGWHIVQRRLYRREGQVVPIPYDWLYTYVYGANRARNQTLAAEFGQVFRALNDAGVRYAVRKGPVITERLYSDPGLRRTSDLDLLVERKEAATAGEVLVGLGYAQGRVAAQGNAVESYSRRTQLFWRANVNNELPYLKVVDDVPFVGRYDVDLCLDIFQRLSESTVEVSDLLDRRIHVPLCGEPVAYALSPADQFVDLCAHLHKEAVSLFYAQKGADIEILKFLDIALSCRELTVEGGWDAVRARVTEYDAGRSMYYALHHTALLYPDDVPSAELDFHRPDDCGYLDEYGTFDGKRERWEMPFLDRMFDPQRATRLRGVTAVPLT